MMNISVTAPTKFPDNFWQEKHKYKTNTDQQIMNVTSIYTEKCST